MLDIISLSDIYQADSSGLDESSLGVVNAIKSGIGCFKCSKSPYHEDFLKNKAVDCSLHHTSKTYLMVDIDALYEWIDTGNNADQIICAFFTIGISSISIVDEKISNKRRKKLKTHTFTRDDTIGCFVIGELCRADCVSSSSLSGLDILDACLGVIKNAQNIIGGRIVLVDSRDKVFEALYSKRGFKELRLANNSTLDGEPLLTAALTL